ncbi:MAG TPA: hypothetical protein VEW48_16900 [Thermoanaerobaculia bacterium]|nr:hypothetical protein [Thermoanaerobaculia bacterium]
MRFRTSAVLPVITIFFYLGAARLALATQVRIFQTQSQAGFLAGTLEGVSVDSLGRMQLAPRAERVTSLSEPFLLSAAAHPDGWVVGTGNAGKVLLIDRKGKTTELLAAAEPEVFAVWADKDGTVFAGTSPRGKVYRIARGKDGTWKSEVFFEPGEIYIWDLARAADGTLLVATGTQGKLFKVSPAGKGEVLYDSDDTHVRSLAVLPGGDVLAGTAGEGLILRIGRDGQARTLYDADEPEVVSLTVAPDGTCYAAVVSSEASLVDLSKDQQAAGTAKPGEPTVTVTVVEEGAPAAPAGTRKPGTTGPRSQVLSISPAGVVESLWSFPEDTVYDLLWQGDHLWVATGLEGKLYRWADSQMLLEKDVDERQIVALLPGEPGPAFATTNAAAVYRITAGTETSGTYTSAALDAGQAARFGTFRWRGEAPGRDSLRFSFRSGLSAEPDRTWSPWTEPKAGESSANGPEISLEDLPRGRYVQWRTELRTTDHGSPQLWGAELSYRQENLKPRIDQLAALDPGQILVPANFNPSNQVYEPAHPNREGIFTVVGQAAEDEGGGRTKPLWKQGFQTLRWAASDPNDDQLVYDLAFRPVDAEKTADAADSGDGGWLTMADELDDDWYSFDATVLPDGVYRFRLRASDRPANDPARALVAERVSDPVVVDHAPPELVEVRRDGERLRVTVRDAASPLREAVLSVDAQEWKPVEAADGLLDGRTETLLIEPGEEAKKGGSLLLLRVTDAAFNVITFNLTQASQR